MGYNMTSQTMTKTTAATLTAERNFVIVWQRGEGARPVRITEVEKVRSVGYHGLHGQVASGPAFFSPDEAKAETHSTCVARSGPTGHQWSPLSAPSRITEVA